MAEQDRAALEQELQRLQAELEERRGSVPIHSIRPHQLIEIEDLEAEIADLRQRISPADEKL